LLPDEGGISPCGNLEDESVRLSLKLDSQQQRHHLLFLLVLSLNIFGQKRQKKSDFFQISSPFRAASSRLSEQ